MGEISELLPCPFDGARAQTGQTLDGFWYVLCTGCETMGSNRFKREAEAIAEWNRRAGARQAPLPTGTVTEAWDRPVEELCRAKAGRFFDVSSEIQGIKGRAPKDREPFIEDNWRNWREDAVLEIVAALAARPAEPVAVKTYAEIVAPYVAAQRMVREAIGELFGPTASIESDEAVLLRGPEPTHGAEAQIAALQRIRSALVSTPAPGLVEALEVARRWLANSMPIVEIDGPKPLPLIDAVLSSITETGGAK